MVRRGDLSDRCVTLTLQAIPEDQRRTEAEVWADVNAVAPKIMGAILDAVAVGLKTLPAVKLNQRPRMADFGVWGEVFCRGLGKKPGEFLAVYATNRQQASESILEESAVAQHLRTMMDNASSWKGIARELLDNLGGIAGDKVVGSKRWPKNPRALSGALRRLAPALRMIGIMVDFSREPHTGTRFTTIETVNPLQSRDFASPASPLSSTSSKSSKSEDLAGDANGDANLRVTQTALRVTQSKKAFASQKTL